MWRNIISLIWIFCHGTSFLADSSFDSARFEREPASRMASGVSDVLKNLDLESCTIECLRRRRADAWRCGAVNYGPGDGTCEIIDARYSTWGTTSAPEWEHWAISPREPPCSRPVTSFEYPETLLGTGSTTQGMISKDALTPSGESKVYLMEGYQSVNLLKIYHNENDFKTGTVSDALTLPRHCHGSGWLVYGARLYCAIDLPAINRVMVYDIPSRAIVNIMTLANLTDGATTRSPHSISYMWGGHSWLDIEADSTGVYVIWADSAYLFSISKIDQATLTVVETWHTEVSKYNAGQAFLICGRMYVTNHYSHTISFIRAVYDLATKTVNTNGTIEYRNVYNYNSHAHYDHRERSLFVYDNHRAVKVQVNF